jgi:hypothetical protein
MLWKSIFFVLILQIPADALIINGIYDDPDLMNHKVFKVCHKNSCKGRWDIEAGDGGSKGCCMWGAGACTKCIDREAAQDLTEKSTCYVQDNKLQGMIQGKCVPNKQFENMCSNNPLLYCNSYDDLRNALCGGHCTEAHEDVCRKHFYFNGAKEIGNGRPFPTCKPLLIQQCPASTIIGLHLSTQRGAGLVGGCCREDLNRGAGGDDIYLHAIRNGGQTFDKAISDLRLTNRDCPSGYKKLTTCCDGGDLNNNAGGDYIYLCYKESRHDSESYLVDLRLTNSRTCPKGWEKVEGSRNGGELNSNAGGENIYLCMRKQKCQTDPVLCRMTIDNSVLGVSYNGQKLLVRGDWNDWQSPKFFSYTPVPGAILEIAGSELSDCDGCKCSGLLLECTNELVSDLVSWTAKGSENSTPGEEPYGSVCQSSSAFYLRGQDFPNAVKIWPQNGAKYAWFSTIPTPIVNQRKL